MEFETEFVGSTNTLISGSKLRTLAFKPPIYWKEIDVVKKQIQSWSDDEVKKMIYKINDLEILVKKNSNNSLNFVSDFVSNY